MNGPTWLTKAIVDIGVRTGHGMAAVGWRIAAWTMRPKGIGARVRRLSLIAGGWWVGERLLAYPRLSALALAVFLIHCYRRGPLEEPQEPEPTHEQRSQEEILLGMLADVIGDAPGIHLIDLLPILRAADPRWAAMELQDLRDMLAAIGCPIRRQLRVGDRTGIPGIHRDDTQAALDRLDHSPDL